MYIKDVDFCDSKFYLPKPVAVTPPKRKPLLTKAQVTILQLLLTAMGCEAFFYVGGL